MKISRNKIAVAGFFATLVFAAVMIIHGRAQMKVIADFRNATTAEVRDASGKILLRGTFAPVEDENSQEVERAATLAPTESGGQASGDAEVEYRKDAPAVQEIEFEVSGVPAGGVVTLVLDGTAVIDATADKKGQAKAEVDFAIAQAGDK